MPSLWHKKLFSSVIFSLFGAVRVCSILVLWQKSTFQRSTWILWGRNSIWPLQIFKYLPLSTPQKVEWKCGREFEANMALYPGLIFFNMYFFTFFIIFYAFFVNLIFWCTRLIFFLAVVEWGDGTPHIWKYRIQINLSTSLEFGNVL